jgi:hypothetical protein
MACRPAPPINHNEWPTYHHFETLVIWRTSIQVSHGNEPHRKKTAPPAVQAGDAVDTA